MRIFHSRYGEIADRLIDHESQIKTGRHYQGI